MLHCEDGKCSQPIFKPLNKAHGFLCEKSDRYHEWHHHPHHKKVHFGVLAVYIVTIVSMVIANLAVPMQKAKASDPKVWSFTSDTDYEFSDAAKIGLVDNQIQLLQSEHSRSGGTQDWISDSAVGEMWLYRIPVTVTNASTGNETTTVKMTNTTLGALNSTFFAQIEADGHTDGDDIRFTLSNGFGAVNYYLESFNTAADTFTLYVKFTNIQPQNDTTYYMYYGNNDAALTAGSSMSGTMGYYEGIVSGGSNFYESNVTYGGAPTFDSDQVTLADAADYITGPDGGYAWNTGPVKYIFKARATSASGPLRLGMLFSDVAPGGGFSLDCSDGTAGPCIEWQLDPTAGQSTAYSYDTTSGGQDGADDVDFLPDAIDEWHIYEIDCVGTGANPTSLNFYRDGTLIHSIAYVNSPRNMPYGGLGLWPLMSGYGEVDDVYGYTSPNAVTAAFGTTVQGLYSDDDPYVTLKASAAQSFSIISNFEDTSSLDGGGIQYQVSPNGGTTWYWYNSGWAEATSAVYAQSNTKATVFANRTTLDDIGDNPRSFAWRVFLRSDTVQQPTVTNITLTYILDDGVNKDPTNPASVTAKTASDGTALSEGTWYNDATPYFSWTASSDTGTPDTSEVDGYWVYFGTTATADPHTAGTYTTNLYYAPTITTSGSYYLRIETKDKAGNVNDILSTDPSLFTYSFDTDVPSNPLLFRTMPSPSTWYRDYTDLSFSWYTSAGNEATDTGGSGLVGATAGYQYRINGGATWYGKSGDTGHVENGVIPFATTGYILQAADAAHLVAGAENTFEIRVVDMAGNNSNDDVPTRTLKTIFRYNNLAPTAVTGLGVDLTPKTVNSFTFSWDVNSPTAPEGYPTPETYIDHYVYKVGATGTEVNVDPATHTVGGKIVEPGVQAAQNGVEQSFIVWAVDESNNSGDETTYAFTVNAPAPGAPRDVEMVDVSNRDQAKYKISINWLEPSDKGAGFNGYNIYRSTTGDYTGAVAIATITGSDATTSYTDTNLSNTTTYYYRIASKDNTGQESASTDAIAQDTRLLYITPTGRYTTAPAVTEAVAATPKAFSSLITWKTDRAASSFVYIAEKDSLGNCNLFGISGRGQPERSTTHSVNLTGLTPSTNYCYKAMWEDSDGNQGMSPTALSFTTKERPTISGVSVDNITLTSATVKWKSTTIVNAQVQYCTGGICGIVKDNSSETDHIVQLSSLQHTSTYTFQITGTDIDGGEVVSDTYSFDTLKKPVISKFRFESVSDAAVSTLHATWETNVPTTSILHYQASGGASANKSDPEYRTVHDITISGLADKTTYILTARGVDQHGNEAVSESNSFTTPDDTRPPKLSNLVIEVKSSGVSSSQKAQIVVSWDTDEPATSQVEFGPGISSDQYTAKSLEDTSKTLAHVVIVSELDPSKLYHLRAVSTDASGNIGRSNDTTAITGKVQKSVIDLIINSLQRSLGFLTKLPFLSK